MTDTRTRLVEAAAALLDKGGPAAVTLRAVAGTVGLSHNAPYRHFKDKDMLLAAIAERELVQSRKKWQAVFDGRMSLINALRAHVRWAIEWPERFRLTYGPWPAEVRAALTAGTDAKLAFVAAVEAAQARGELPPSEPERLARLLLATANGAATQSLNGHLARGGKWDGDAEDVVADLLDFLNRD
ncbi:TetR/AcrR family transcriptional regulator [Martelella lutilitoris]|nr:TetR/AcrR family transcriptional regulator [Martelella lutilitoris]